jgi:hypothetical protein
MLSRSHTLTWRVLNTVLLLDSTSEYQVTNIIILGKSNKSKWEYRLIGLIGIGVNCSRTWGREWDITCRTYSGWRCTALRDFLVMQTRIFLCQIVTRNLDYLWPKIKMPGNCKYSISNMQTINNRYQTSLTTDSSPIHLPSFNRSFEAEVESKFP